ncbi:hypothetical protein TS85_02820 [Sphingomonas hengshuiensis]|uniref:Uncharacterized protein n=1 Tax=Sphingomonas hengshuiensis TaxID=1609977 RepID=A0A7U4LE52_9SPHN|nr:hypothetical protein [Sphingomonas hengshuiensis]AJP70985.1 hypothetical protein TS85_02820 [Sphingomonas hengshuiensis]
MIAAVAAWAVISLAAPKWMSDKNPFLREFVGADMLSFLGVVVTITLASTANLHFEFNKMEEAAGSAGFPKTRLRLRQSAYWLIGMLLIALALIVAKPWFGPSDVATSLANGAALLIVLFNLLVLIDITQMAFTISPKLPEKTPLGLDTIPIRRTPARGAGEALPETDIEQVR